MSRAGPVVRRAALGLAGAALLVAVATVAARLAGFGRWLVFSRTVGSTCLGDTYLTANQLPNVLFEVVAGGALASAIVPVLAGPLARGRKEEAERTASALLTWTVVLLTPLALAGALLARPVVGFFLDRAQACGGPAAVDVATRMLLIFLPQVVLYGIGIVLTGVLQAHRRFLGPAIAPLLSSAVVAAAYVLFAGVDDGPRGDLRALGLPAELVLSVGTTLGVAVLSLGLLLPLRRTGTRLRPTLRFPAGVAGRVRALALAGLAALLAQQASVLVVLRLANAEGTTGSLTLYQYAWTLYLLPYAVLAVPIATVAFPRLATQAEPVAPAAEPGVDAPVTRGPAPEFATTAAATTRAVVLVSCAGAALLAATASPLARVFVVGAPGEADPGALRAALLAFAPGLLGYGVLAHIGRALYANGQGRAAATATVIGWSIVVLADLALVAALPADATVVALGLGNTAGMTAAGVLLAAVLARSTAGRALAGVPRAVLAGLGAGCLAALAGWAVSAPFSAAGPLTSAALALLSAATATVTFTALAFGLDRDDARLLLDRARSFRP